MPADLEDPVGLPRAWPRLARRASTHDSSSLIGGANASPRAAKLSNMSRLEQAGASRYGAPGPGTIAWAVRRRAHIGLDDAVDSSHVPAQFRPRHRSSRRGRAARHAFAAAQRVGQFAEGCALGVAAGDQHERIFGTLAMLISAAPTFVALESSIHVTERELADEAASGAAGRGSASAPARWPPGFAPTTAAPGPAPPSHWTRCDARAAATRRGQQQARRRARCTRRARSRRCRTRLLAGAHAEGRRVHTSRTRGARASGSSRFTTA